MISKIDKTANCATINGVNTTHSRSGIMTPEKPKGNEEPRIILDPWNMENKNAKDLSEGEKKTAWDLSRYIKALKKDEYFDYITGKCQQSETDSFQTIMERSELFKKRIERYKEVYEKLNRNDSRFWEYLVREEQNKQRKRRLSHLRRKLDDEIESFYNGKKILNRINESLTHADKRRIPEKVEAARLIFAENGNMPEDKQKKLTELIHFILLEQEDLFGFQY